MKVQEQRKLTTPGIEDEQTAP